MHPFILNTYPVICFLLAGPFHSGILGGEVRSDKFKNSRILYFVFFRCDHSNRFIQGLAFFKMLCILFINKLMV